MVYYVARFTGVKEPLYAASEMVSGKLTQNLDYSIKFNELTNCRVFCNAYSNFKPESHLWEDM
jgi:hypothetical protein